MHGRPDDGDRTNQGRYLTDLSPPLVGQNGVRGVLVGEAHQIRNRRLHVVQHERVIELFVDPLSLPVWVRHRVDGLTTKGSHPSNPKAARDARGVTDDLLGGIEGDQAKTRRLWALLDHPIPDLRVSFCAKDPLKERTDAVPVVAITVHICQVFAIAVIVDAVVGNLLRSEEQT